MEPNGGHPREFNANDFHVVLKSNAGNFRMVSWPIAICSPEMVVLRLESGLLPILTHGLPTRGFLPVVTLCSLDRFKQLVCDGHVPTRNPKLGSSEAALQEWLVDIDAFAAQLLAADELRSARRLF